MGLSQIGCAVTASQHIFCGFPLGGFRSGLKSGDQIYITLMLACLLGLIVAAPIPNYWDEHVAEISNGNKHQKACIPYKLTPESKIKGIIVLYHGFTACPSSFKDTAGILVNNGYMVLAPLLPGHGVRFKYGCEKKDSCINNRDNPSFLPTSKKGYETWTDWSLKMVKEQADLIPANRKDEGFFIGGVGHSAGGAMVQYAIARPNSPMTRALVVNPYFVFSNPQLDFLVKRCDSEVDKEKCLKPVLDKISNQAQNSIASSGSPDSLDLAKFVESLKKLTSKSISQILLQDYDDVAKIVFIAYQRAIRSGNFPSMEATQSWGEDCYKGNELGRGGICAIRYKHLSALTDFGNSVLALVDKVPKSVIYGNIHSDRDGPTRDSVAAAIVERLSSRGVKATRCRYRIAKQCSLSQISLKNNFCGMPHSCFSEPEAQAVPPNKRGVWFKDLNTNIVRFFLAKPLGKKTATDNECEARKGTVDYGPQFDRIGVKLLAEAKKFYGE
jgi:pimeloyl-ACP methyl ester carboxylesterase